MSKITRKRGDTYPIILAVLKNTGTIDAPVYEPQDLTGFTDFKLTVDPSQAPADATANLFTLTGAIADSVAGTVSYPVSLTNADHLGNFFFDAQLTSPAGDIYTFDSGKFVFSQDITK